MSQPLLEFHQKTREGCGCLWDAFGGSRGKVRESPGKIAGKCFPNREMLQILGFWAPGKANLPGTLGRHCPGPCTHLPGGVFFEIDSSSLLECFLGRTPSTAGTFRKKFRKNSGKTPETLSERFLEFPSRVRLGCPKPYNSRHLRLPERFQNSPPPSTAGDASFFRIGSGEGLSELVMEFPAVLGVLLISDSRRKETSPMGRCARVLRFMGREVQGRYKFGIQAVKWVVVKLQGDKTASFCKKMSGREVTGR